MFDKYLSPPTLKGDFHENGSCGENVAVCFHCLSRRVHCWRLQHERRDAWLGRNGCWDTRTCGVVLAGYGHFFLQEDILPQVIAHFRSCAEVDSFDRGALFLFVIPNLIGNPGLN